MRFALALGALALTLAANFTLAQPRVASPTEAAAPASADAPSSPADATPTVGGSPSLTKENVDIWLDGLMPYALSTGDVAGAVVVVVRDGQVLTQRGFGYADVASRRVADPETTLFRTGSIGKLFTWTAVMQMVEAGRIDLDADVNRYLDFQIPAHDGGPVTMRHLMTHTAGFEERNRDLIFNDENQILSLGDYLKSWVPRRIFAAGTTPAYSNYGTALAGYVVERVSGVPFADYVEQRIFRPLGMRHATFRQPVPGNLSPMLANGYFRASGEPGRFEFTSATPAGSLSLSGADMARFMIAHLDGGAGLMRPQTAQLMQNNPTTILPHLNRMHLGFFETNINGRRVIGHLGDTALFHGAMHLFPDERVGLYVVVNSAGRSGAAGTIRGQLFEGFADRYFPARAAPAGQVDAATAAEHARMMAGQWQNSRRSENGFMRLFNMMGQVTVTANGQGELVIDVLRTPAGAPRRWVEVAPFLWQEVNGHQRIAAIVEDGRVVRWSSDFFSPFMVFDRVSPSRSAAWILPALYGSLAILLLTFLHWPIAALVRRRYKDPLPFEGKARLAYRGVRLAAGLSAGIFGGWVLVASDLRSTSDTMLWALQILGLPIFLLMVGMAGWNLLLAWRARRPWASRVAALLILAASAMVLYVAVAFGLVDMTVRY